MMYLISLGLGLEQLTLGSVSESSSLLTLNVTAGSESQRPLTPDTVALLSKVDKVTAVLPKLTVKGQVTLDSTFAPVTIEGVDPGYFGVDDSSNLSVGRPYRADDRQTMVVTSGFLTLFGLDKGKTPLVVFGMVFDADDYPGIAPLANINVAGLINNTSAVVYVPRLYLENALNKNFSSYESAKVKVGSVDDVDSVSKAIIAQGFKVAAVVDTVAEIKQVFSVIRIVMGSLGLIAILVASIGMFNTLTVSLLERTKEIGIMKALGVKKGDIRRLFLLEALLMGLIGGLIGVVGALVFEQITTFALSLLATYLQGTVPRLFINQPTVVGGFMLLSMLIAGLTGLYPASRATKINPIEAIRYE